jgi:hypothetical protein
MDYLISAHIVAIADARVLKKEILPASYTGMSLLNER